MSSDLAKQCRFDADCLMNAMADDGPFVALQPRFAKDLVDELRDAADAIEYLTAERDEYRKLWLDSCPVPDYGRPLEENEDE